MKESITIFHPKKSKKKHAFSPFDDKTFVFETYESTSNLQMYSVMVSHFILNIPLALLEKPIRTFRRMVNLDPYYDKTLNYLVLDIDDLESEENKQTVLDYFKDYKVILGESTSYNGINNFNMKGLLFLESIPIKDIKLALSNIHHDLKDICTIDEAVGRKASLNAPIGKNNIFMNNEDGIRYKFVRKEVIEHIEAIKNEYVGESVSVDIDQLKDIEADTMEKLCLKVFVNLGYTAIKNNANGSITFKHPSEKKSVGGYFWFSNSPYTMHHANSTKTINIFDSIRKLPQAKELMKKEINYDSEFLDFNTQTKVIQVNEKYLEVNNDISDMVDDFLNKKDGLLSIRSPMGTGKSTLIHHIIDECHSIDMKVLIVTNRISVAKDFGKKYGLKVYNKDKYETGDSLVCQYDSLWKYNIKHFDVVVMDEFISLMIHSRSNLNNSSINIAKFFGCFNKKLVIADAFLTGYENFLLSNKDSNINLIDNNYRDPTTLFDYTDFNYFTQSILFHAKEHKITVSATSLNFINSLQMLLIKKGLKVVTLTAATPESTKDLIYELFEKDTHDKWDVLIYSPTLTVGVSNLNNVPYHFHYDSSMSTDSISSIQMMKRTRKTKEIHMYVKPRVNYLKTSYNDIRDEYMGNIGKNIDQNYLFDIDNYGEAKLSDLGKKAIKIDTFKNILEFNHKEALSWLLKYHFMKEPRIINDKFEANVLGKYTKIIREDNKEVLKSHVEQFLSLNEMEKTTLLMDADVDATMRILAEIDSVIKECSPTIKSKILECTMNDRAFTNKSKYFKVAFNYTKKIWDEADVKYLVSQAVIKGKNDDLHFYNVLLSYGQKEIHDDYTLKTINSNKHLKYILDKCGYKNERITGGSINTVGYRGYVVDANIKQYYGFIK
jgi:hypothetical protein